MRKYPAEHWKTLGAWIHDLRIKTPYSDMKAWVDKVGRSDRVLLGLERGEVVGPKTIEAVAAGLGIRPAPLFETLATGVVPREFEVVGDMRDFIKEFMPQLLVSFDEHAASGQIGQEVKLREATVGPGSEDAEYVASPGDRKEAGATDAEVLREIRAMREDVRELSERVARIEQQDS